MKAASLIALLSATSCSLVAANIEAKPSVFMIRHGEKPDNGVTGLSERGQKRAECLKRVFGPHSGYNIGFIITQQYKQNGKRKRPYDTVKPLADKLDLTINHECDRNNAGCVDKLVKGYKGDGNILICWEHKMLSTIAEALGGSDIGDYPSSRFDQIWEDRYPYTHITSIETENCPGLDENGR